MNGRKHLIMNALIFLAAGLMWIANFPSSHLIASTVFLAIICGTLFFWRFRLAYAFGGLSVLLACNLIDVPHIVEFAGLDIILFLVGMMTLIGYLEEKHFFEYVVARIEDKIGHRPFLMIGMLMVISAVLAALIDEVTSILVMTTSLFHLLRRYNIKPIPFLLMTIFATNIGSSATAVGNPIGVMIAMRGEFAFVDFLRWATPITIVVLIVTVPLCFLLFKDSIRNLGIKMNQEKGEIDEASHVKFNKKNLQKCTLLFLGTVLALICHSQIEVWLGLKKNTMLLGTSLAAGAIAIILSKDNAREFFMRHVDWWTLAFFMSLFASVGTLSYVGVTDRIASLIFTIGQDSFTTLFFVFSTAIGVLTALMDNVLAVATFIPVLGDLAEKGVDTFALWWGMLFSGTLFGNLTVIGSTANIVAMGQLERSYNEHISFMEWLKPGLIVGIITLTIALALLYLQFSLMPTS